MIPWRTSRFLLMFFLLIGSVTAIAALTMVDRATLLGWQDTILALRPGASPAVEPTASPAPVVDGGHAAELPRYPVVEINLDRAVY